MLAATQSRLGLCGQIVLVVVCERVENIDPYPRLVIVAGGFISFAD